MRAGEGTRFQRTFIEPPDWLGLGRSVYYAERTTLCRNGSEVGELTIEFRPNGARQCWRGTPIASPAQRPAKRALYASVDVADHRGGPSYCQVTFDKTTCLSFSSDRRCTSRDAGDGRGLEAMRQIKEQRPGIAIVIASAHLVPSDRERFRRSAPLASRL